MSVSPLAGHLPPPSSLVNVPRLITAYFTERPDASVPEQRVSFGTSGHRGSPFDRAFNERHILAIAQAICAYRKGAGIDGPLFIGKDTHAVSEPAFVTALEVLAANGVEVMVPAGDYTPTPAISHAILTYNRGRSHGLADGIVITPSHNPPQDGGFKYNPPSGGPADTDITGAIQQQANVFLERDLDGVRRIPYEQAQTSPCIHTHDYVDAYVRDLPNVIDLDAIKASGIRMGVDPLGGASLAYWERIVDMYHLNLTIVNTEIDPAFRFMTVDWDGNIRMDPSSSYAMQSLIGLKDRFDIAFACDADADRHGIVTPSAGLMQPNHYLTAAIAYLFRNRSDWPTAAAIGKTVVSSDTINRVGKHIGRDVYEVPVGFKWFVDGLLDGSLGFGGEESAGASFLRLDGGVWTTDKDGIIPCLLAAEMTAHGGKDPAQLYSDLTSTIGNPVYDRVEAPADTREKDVLKRLSPDDVRAGELAGEPIETVLTSAPGNGKPIGGVKVIAHSGWIAARPSGTEDIYKIYAESFKGEEHLRRIEEQAREIVSQALAGATVSSR